MTTIYDVVNRFLRGRAGTDGRVQRRGNDDRLFGAVLDSVGVLELAAFIEDETGVRIPDRELRVENFQDIASIDAMVQRLMEGAREVS